MFWLGLVIGVTVGVIFHATISKWAGKAKSTAQEIGSDIKADIDKTKKP